MFDNLRSPVRAQLDIANDTVFVDYTNGKNSTAVGVLNLTVTKPIVVHQLTLKISGQKKEVYYQRSNIIKDGSIMLTSDLSRRFKRETIENSPTEINFDNRLYQQGTHEIPFELSVDVSNPESIDSPHAEISYVVSAELKYSSESKKNKTLTCSHNVNLINFLNYGSTYKASPISTSSVWRKSVEYSFGLQDYHMFQKTPYLIVSLFSSLGDLKTYNILDLKVYLLQDLYFKLVNRDVYSSDCFKTSHETKIEEHKFLLHHKHFDNQALTQGQLHVDCTTVNVNSKKLTDINSQSLKSVHRTYEGDCFKVNHSIKIEVSLAETSPNRSRPGSRSSIEDVQPGGKVRGIRLLRQSPNPSNQTDAMYTIEYRHPLVLLCNESTTGSVTPPLYDGETVLPPQFAQALEN